MRSKIILKDLGLADYKEVWSIQESIFNTSVARKLKNRESLPEDKEAIENTLILVEHPHVYTLGKSGQASNLLINDELMKRIGATYYHIDRGGDITYHGPGQIVGYPIFDIEQFSMHIKQYVNALEEVIILTLEDLGISGRRMNGATGVWIEPETCRARKICAIGVKASRHITMHGFAFNINTQLEYFNHINPCGFIDKGVTSVERELGKKQDFELIKMVLAEKLISFFNNHRR